MAKMTLKEAVQQLDELEDKLDAAEARAAELEDERAKAEKEAGEAIADLEASVTALQTSLDDALKRLATLGDQAAKELAEVVDVGIPEDAILSVRAISPNGFSRCGRRWGAKEQFVRHGEFSLADLERLLAEPNLETRKLK